MYPIQNFSKHITIKDLIILEINMHKDKYLYYTNTNKIMAEQQE